MKLRIQPCVDRRLRCNVGIIDHRGRYGADRLEIQTRNKSNPRTEFIIRTQRSGFTHSVIALRMTKILVEQMLTLEREYPTSLKEPSGACNLKHWVRP
jgi:hypothetical protein